MKSFNVPEHYRSPLITQIKTERKAEDKLKKNYEPTTLVIGTLTVLLARHFGFCYGVENAIEIAFGVIAENPGRRIFLLGEMIHNQGVNDDLQKLGVQFIMDPKGKMNIKWDELTSEDIVIIPAFGTTVEIERELLSKGIAIKKYETTCPFVERVWNKAEKLAEDGYTVVIHGKPGHEETKATFSHAKEHSKAVIVKDLEQAVLLNKYIAGDADTSNFFVDFEGQYSLGFNPTNDLKRIGVVNQTTMLATETQAIADYLKSVVEKRNVGSTLEKPFADTRDTLCYATNDNQNSVLTLLNYNADFALVIGGYNSSNTSHLVELCEAKLPTYFIKDEHCITENGIKHFDFHQKIEKESLINLEENTNLRIMITSGASCPDALVERVIHRISFLTGNEGALKGLLGKQGIKEN